MEVVNKTASVTHVLVSSLEDPSQKYGFLTTKTTFCLQEDGATVLETQDPYGISLEDRETELGILPTDIVPRYDDAFEVILLGAAYGRGSRETTVRLTVGAVTREIVVSGDRRWLGEGQHAAPSRPEPFDRIPLSWSRAFGGSVPVHVDADSIIDLSCTMNPYGRGFDAWKMAGDVEKAFECPPGFPKIEYERWLPNLEHPGERIRHPSDEPLPYCWATVPTDAGVHLIRQIRHLTETGTTLAEADAVRMLHHRAHPDWIIDVPSAGARVELAGAAPEGLLGFELPQIRILADYDLGDRRGTKELAPHMLVLLPEDRRLYLIHRLGFSMATEPDRRRSFRIRHKPGWFQSSGRRAA